jgi:Domain of unknown function (DUF4388)
MAMLGDLSEFSLPDILQMFERAAKTGQLSIWAPTGIHRIWFYQGRVITALSPDKQQNLRQLLIDCQAIDSQTALHLSTFCQLNEPLGSYLRKQSLTSSAQLAIVFRQQLKTGLYSLFALKSGQFRFAANVPLPYDEMTGMSKGGMDAAMEGLRQFESLEQNLKDLPQPDSTLVKMASELPLLKLSGLEWGIWERISSENPVRVIAQQLQADLLDVRKACLRLMQVGLIEEIPVSLTTPPAAVSLPSPKELKLEKSVKETSQKASKEPEAVATKAPVNTSLLSRLTTVLKAMR